jgi:Uri superfamily endonuclease
MFRSQPQKGTYVLVLSLARHSFFPVVGHFRNVNLPAGYYAYVGSAFGAGGLRARVGRHLRLEKKLHWHIDYVRPAMVIAEVWVTEDTQRRECDWSRLVGTSLGGVVPVPGMGSADCDHCPAHFYYFAKRPSFTTFSTAVMANIPGHALVVRIQMQTTGPAADRSKPTGLPYLSQPVVLPNGRKA